MTAYSAPRLSRILLVNDDGIDAEGIRVSEEIASQFADEAWVVAPENPALVFDTDRAKVWTDALALHKSEH